MRRPSRIKQYEHACAVSRHGNAECRLSSPASCWRLNGSPPQHNLSEFRNGKHDSLDAWLRDRALASEGLSARTYVVCASEAPSRVVDYYAISTAMAHRSGLPNAKMRRGMPDEAPLLLIGRLAVDVTHQKRGLGTDLLIDALRRCLSAADTAGARAVITHAIADGALAFYERHGFLRCPLSELTMLMPIETVRLLQQSS